MFVESNECLLNKQLRFPDIIWKYEIANKKIKIQYIQAVVTFDKKKTNCMVTDIGKDPMDVMIMTNFSVCFLKNNYIATEQKNHYISVDYNHMTEIFSLEKIWKFREDIAKWWADDWNYLLTHRGGLVFIPPKSITRFYDYNDEITNQFLN